MQGDPTSSQGPWDWKEAAGGTDDTDNGDAGGVTGTLECPEGAAPPASQVQAVTVRQHTL